MNSEDLEILKTIHSSNPLGVVTRKSNKPSGIHNDGYLIHANNETSFTKNFAYLTQEIKWNPCGKFLIIIESLDVIIGLKNIFDELLKYHVINVVIMHGVHMYTYNPYENYACGNYYNRIISLGNCINSTEDLFPDKLVNGLKGCTLKIGTPHWPPYTIDKPLEITKGNIGVEQRLLKIIGEMEQFNVNFSYTYDPDIFSTISPDLSATGPLRMLQTNETDIMIGGLLLVPSRASVFDYLHGHLDYYDDIIIVVKKAPLIAPWKQFYTEFQPIVWALIFVAFTIYSSVMIILLRAKDKCYIFMKLLDVLLLHGFNIRGRMTLKFIFIIWVASAFVINSFYQTSLTSLSTKPNFEYQIFQEEDLNRYNIKPCISSSLSFLDKDSEFGYFKPDVYNQVDSCKGIFDSIKTVANSSKLYTLGIYSIYRYNKNMFLDEWGDSLVYVFPKPMLGIIYAMYTYKGFPLQHKLNMYALRLRENGLVDKLFNDQYFVQMIQHQYRQRTFQIRLVVPWLIFVTGLVLSSLAFVLEIIHQKYHSRRHE